MAQYIDKAALVAELDRLYNLEYDGISNLSCGKKIMLKHILLFLNTLEMKEEVTTTDAFIEKACEFLKSYRQDTCDGLGYMAGIVNDETIENFKKYMKGE